MRLGLLKGRVPALIKEGAYRKFFMHRTGHWLGMDVHDVGHYQDGEAHGAHRAQGRQGRAGLTFRRLLRQEARIAGLLSFPPTDRALSRG